MGASATARDDFVPTAALALAACTHVGTCATEATIADYRLRPGDQVHVTVHGHEDLRGEFEVDLEGNLAAPLPISARAKGVTARQLEAQIEARLESGGYVNDPQVSVHILRYRPIHLFDVPLAYRPGMTVDDLFARYNPSPYTSDQSEWLIERGDCSVEAEPDTELLPGDTITIRERFF